VPLIIVGVGLLTSGLGSGPGHEGLDSSTWRIIGMVLITLAGFAILILRVTVRLEP